MLQGLTPAERAHMAAAMGVSPQQLAQVKAHVFSLDRSLLVCCGVLHWPTSILELQWYHSGLPYIFPAGYDIGVEFLFDFLAVRFEHVEGRLLACVFCISLFPHFATPRDTTPHQTTPHDIAPRPGEPGDRSNAAGSVSAADGNGHFLGNAGRGRDGGGHEGCASRGCWSRGNRR